MKPSWGKWDRSLACWRWTPCLCFYFILISFLCFFLFLFCPPPPLFFLFCFVLFCSVKSLSLVLVNWYFSSVKMVFCEGFAVFHFEVDLKLLMNGGWYTQNLECDLCCELQINLIWNTFKHINSTDKHIVSGSRNNKKYICFKIHSFICCTSWVYLGKG